MPFIDLCPYSLTDVGDWYCDSSLNIQECSYDGGDCCWVEWFGDGFCHANNNNPECDFDGGDCCSSKIYNISQIGDGICDDDTNNKECRWDGNDCCGTNTTDVDTTRCIECTCYQGRYYCFLFSNAAFF